MIIPGVTTPAPAVETKMRVYDALSRAGLLAAAAGGVCYDLGDSACYAGSGQTLTDLLGTMNAYLGNTSSADSDDPAFVGTAGALSQNEKLTFDGGDNLKITGSNPSGVDNLHKDNAKYTVLAALNLDATNTTRALYGTGTTQSHVGMRFNILGNRRLQPVVCNGSGSAFAFNQSSTAGLPAGEWCFAGTSLDEAAGAGGVNYYVNGVHEAVSSTYSSPSAASASLALQIGANGNSAARMLSGDQLAFLVLLFGHAASPDQFDRFFNLLRGRFFA